MRLTLRHCTVILKMLSLFYCFPILAVAAQTLQPFNNDAGLFDPAKGPIKIGYQLFKDAEEVEIRVVDFRGQVANRFTFVDLRAGDQFFEWDGTDNNGERVVDGRYQFRMFVDFTDGTKDIANVDVMVATIEVKPGVQIPAPLPAEKFPHRLYGTLGTFYRYNNEFEDKDDGEIRFRTGVDYKDETRTLKGSFQAIQDYNGSSATFNGTQAMAEQRWDSGKIKGVFRDNLGNFDDPFQLFSDFKTERNKIGASVNQGYNRFNASGVVFSSEGDVNSEERGAAARFSYGDKKSWLIGTSYTYRTALDDFSSEEKNNSQVLSADFLYSISDSFSVVAQIVTTDDDLEGEDYGGGIKGEYDFGTVRLSAGYTNLGENFKADFADPLHHVDSDAQGFDANVDYYLHEPIWYFSNFSATLRFFNLTRHSDDSTVQEIDGSVRFGIGEKDTFFMSVYSREDEFGDNANYMGSITHDWDDYWSNMFQANFSKTDNTDSLRLSFNTNYTDEEYTGRLSLEWTRRNVEYSRFSPYDLCYIRFDINNELWHLQLQGKYTHNDEESGVNLFGRIDYKPEYLHRYQMVTYVSLGNRSSLETEEQFEIGIEVQF